MSEAEAWVCPRNDCDLDAEGHDLALAIEHIYGGVPSKDGRDFDSEQSEEIAGRIIDRVADSFGLPQEREEEGSP